MPSAFDAAQAIERQALDAASFVARQAIVPIGGWPAPAVSASTTKRVVLQSDFDVVETPTGGYAQAEVVIDADDKLHIWTASGGGGGELSDGDKGDITVSSSGATWTIDANVVSDTKLRDSAALSVIGRSANSTGDPADIAAGTDGHVLRRSGTSLGFGQIATAGIADAAVTNAKIDSVAWSKVTSTPTTLSGYGITDSVLAAAGAFTTAAPTSAVAAVADNELVRQAELNIVSGFLATGIADVAVITGAKTSETIFHQGSQPTVTNMPAAATVLLGATHTVRRRNLSGFVECRLVVIQGAAASSGSKIRLRYSASLTTTYASTTQLGASADVDIALSTSATQSLTSAWFSIAAGAKTDVHLVAFTVGGDGVADPSFFWVAAEFR